MLQKVVLSDGFARFSDTWSPKVAGEINDMQVKLVKFEGPFTWHHHEHEDEMFLVVGGALRIELEDGRVDLAPGEFVIVPHGVEHRPVALPKAEVLLFEPGTTVNTGNAVDDDRTVTALDRLDRL
ncbi:cupin domain-containing protein [Mycobacteroides chelonae]|uniref:cupin domain-containing protein n=1 Tax=Mycobacteroides chelonae TaxID=1774 RepID=UPI0008A87946|nr:cupin domain-containing protein [Mycobacteroides chelonae]OHU64972.1 cupin [Mycobacteroides chelonae]